MSVFMNLTLPDDQIYMNINYVIPVTQKNKFMTEKYTKKKKKTSDAGLIN